MDIVINWVVEQQLRLIKHMLQIGFLSQTLTSVSL